MLDVPLKCAAGALFTGSTFSMVVELSYFLSEVHMATRTVRLEPPPLADPEHTPPRRPCPVAGPDLRPRGAQLEIMPKGLEGPLGGAPSPRESAPGGLTDCTSAPIH